MVTITHLNPEDLLSTQVLSSKVPKLQNSDVHLYTIDRKLYNDQLTYSDYFLIETEQNRAKKFRFKKDHDLFVIGRYLTKILLAYYTDCSPENVNIMADVCGKPASNLSLSFNVSHSDEQLFLGFSTSSIGVDIERKYPLTNMQSVGKSHFSKKEYHVLMNAAYDKKLDTFFEIWTKKESLIKGIGKGLSINLTDFSVLSRDGKVYWNPLPQKSYGDWYVREADVKQAYKSAFATQQSSVNASHFSLDV